MKTGMLWQDLSKRALQERVNDAVSYYRQKYGAIPTACFVPIGEIDTPGEAGGCMLKPHKCIRPGYLWLGRDDDE